MAEWPILAKTTVQRGFFTDSMAYFYHHDRAPNTKFAAQRSFDYSFKSMFNFNFFKQNFIYRQDIGNQ